MQTASKVEIDNWSDINGQNIMNIRPVGTYPKPSCQCQPHHKPCFPPIHEVHHQKPECDCHHIPVDVQPLPPHFYPVDLDGDGFVENDIIVKPIPHHHHCHPVPPVSQPHCYCSENVEETVEETVNTQEELQMIPEGTYGSAMTQTVVQENDINVEPIEEPTLNELDDVLTDVWSNSQVVDTDTNEIVSEQTEPDIELHEVEEPIKPARVRRVNRGGRRKKED